MVAVLPEFRKQYTVELTPEQEELLASYKYLLPDCSDDDLLAFAEWRDKSIPQCSMCPGQFTKSVIQFDPNRKRRKKATE